MVFNGTVRKAGEHEINSTGLYSSSVENCSMKTLGNDFFAIRSKPAFRQHDHQQIQHAL